MLDVTDHLLFLEKLLAGQSQTQLANSLGVTHATLNRWYHGGHKPHKRHALALKKLYEAHDFAAKLEKDDLPEKWFKAFADLKRTSASRPRLSRNNTYLIENMELFTTFTSLKLDGSSLTLAAIEALLRDDKVSLDHSFTEHLEAKNHARAFYNMVQAVKFGTSIDSEYILNMHQTLMNGILSSAGQVRTSNIRYVCSTDMVANDDILFNKFNDLVKVMAATTEAATLVRLHVHFVATHAFFAGNGRVARLLLNHQLMLNGYPPIVIRAERKNEYETALNLAQTQGDFEPILKFCHEEILYTMTLLAN